MINYQLVSGNHPSGCARGGAAVIVRNDIQNKEFLIHESPELQVSAINIHLHGVNTTIAVAFAPTNQAIDHTVFSDLFSLKSSIFLSEGITLASLEVQLIGLTRAQCHIEFVKNKHTQSKPREIKEIGILLTFFVTFIEITENTINSFQKGNCLQERN